MGPQALVSVVTPVHNGAPYLSECIESVLAQTYDHWDYVILDNCSTDSSRAIAERYAEKDRRIRVVGTDRLLDVMRSQNTAFRQISTDSVYCKMVHADDWLFPDCLREMVEVAEEHPRVGIVGAYRLDGVEVGCDGLPYPSTAVSGRELARMTLLGGPGVYGSATSLLFRSDVVRERERMYDEGDFHADSGACFDILQTWDFGFVHQVLTYTRRHAGTQTSFAQTVNSYQAAELRHLVRYGRAYLTPDEYQACFARILGRYYRFLAKSMTGPHAGTILRYHRTAMAQEGHAFNWRRMVRELLPFSGYALRHPGATIRLGLRLAGLGTTGTESAGPK